MDQCLQQPHSFKWISISAMEWMFRWNGFE